ncbi:hypothetical protein VNO77_16156 [Canavalia gladiata]|uniref:Pentatricopeptide repeat-containing protein n=1 Tax=Canavalia gladiata TaxID=3824 RepID=A0AAN9M190_CANGL
MGAGHDGAQLHGRAVKLDLERHQFICNTIIYTYWECLLVFLTACKHLGATDKARDYFELMMNKYEVEPTIKHYTCMVEVQGERFTPSGTRTTNKRLHQFEEVLELGLLKKNLMEKEQDAVQLNYMERFMSS